MSWKLLSLILAIIAVIYFLIVAYEDVTYHQYMRIGFLGSYVFNILTTCVLLALHEHDKSKKKN